MNVSIRRGHSHRHTRKVRDRRKEASLEPGGQSHHKMNQHVIANVKSAYYE
jgi:hypothetical protein